MHRGPGGSLRRRAGTPRCTGTHPRTGGPLPAATAPPQRSSTAPGTCQGRQLAAPGPAWQHGHGHVGWMWERGGQAQACSTTAAGTALIASPTAAALATPRVQPHGACRVLCRPAGCTPAGCCRDRWIPSPRRAWGHPRQGMECCLQCRWQGEAQRCHCRGPHRICSHHAKRDTRQPSTGVNSSFFVAALLQRGRRSDFLPTIGQLHQGEVLGYRPVQQDESDVVGGGGLVLWQLHIAGVHHDARRPPQLVLMLQGAARLAGLVQPGATGRGAWGSPASASASSARLKRLLSGVH